MATGDQADIASRIRRVLPPAWFPRAPGTGQATAAPVLDAVLAGLGAGWAAIYALYTYAVAQTRIATATDCFLDLAALDFFGSRIERRPGETDNPFRARILAALFQPKDTRAALIEVLTDLTGIAPVVFEPAWPHDTGGYGSLSAPAGGGGSGYGAGAGGAQLWTRSPGQAGGEPGGWGTMSLPFQFFVTAYRPVGGGIAVVAGYGAGAASPAFAPGAVTSRTASATYIDQNGVMQTAGPGVVRPLYSGGVLQGLLLEAASTNEVHNGSASGAGAGMLPTDWTGGGGVGVTMTVIGWGTEAGLSYVDVRFSGTATATATLGIQFGGQTVIAAAAGQTWDYSAFIRVSGGSLAGIYTIVIQTIEFNSSLGIIGDPGLAIGPTAAVLTANRFSFSFVTPAATAYLWPTWYFGVVNGAAIDITFRFAGIQVEQSPAATSYIPTSGTAATRDADALSDTEHGAGGYGAGPSAGSGAGAIEWADQDLVSGQVTDAAIDAAIAGVLPAAYQAWVRIES